MTAPDPGPPITCPRTGRTWPRAHQIDLRTCTDCGGLIDIRHESWLDGPRHAGHCPDPAVADLPAAPVTVCDRCGQTLPDPETTP